MLHLRRKRKRWFTVYVDGPLRKTQTVVRELKQNYQLVRRTDGRRRFQKFDLHIAPKLFRKFQEEYSENVAIAYELKESK